MSQTPAPGPELDARLAEAMGLERDGAFFCRLCLSPEIAHWRSPGADYQDVWCGDGRALFSGSISAVVSAAEEMRKAGRIGSWSVASGDRPVAHVFGPCPPDDMRFPLVATQVGESPSHALTLALLEALRG
jgi:hypothetical protein